MVAGRQSAAVSCGALALVALALIIPGATAFGFSNVPVGGVACRAGALASTCEARRPAMRAALRMGREDGGADKISRPGTGGGVGNKPGQGAGDGGAGERESGGAGVAVLTKPPDVDKMSDLDKKEAVDKEPIWRVLLHNDDVHTFDYVIDTIVSVVRTVTRKKAHRITMEAHKSGLATVTTTWKQLAREYSLGLQKAGLTSSIAPDKSNSC